MQYPVQTPWWSGTLQMCSTDRPTEVLPVMSPVVLHLAVLVVTGNVHPHSLPPKVSDNQSPTAQDKEPQPCSSPSVLHVE